MRVEISFEANLLLSSSPPLHPPAPNLSARQVVLFKNSHDKPISVTETLAAVSAALFHLGDRSCQITTVAAHSLCGRRAEVDGASS
jgi:hypothetical protein